MTDIEYPNPEHRNADKAASRRALAALRDVIEHAETLARRIEGGYEPHGEDAQRIADAAIRVAVNFSALETLRDVRASYAADRAEEVARLLARPELLTAMANALSLRTDLNLPHADRNADLARRVLEAEAKDRANMVGR